MEVLKNIEKKRKHSLQDQEVLICFQGSFERWFPEKTIQVSIKNTCSIKQLRMLLEKKFQSIPEVVQILRMACFATERSLLNEEDVLENIHCVYVLPPVCGG